MSDDGLSDLREDLRRVEGKLDALLVLKATVDQHDRTLGRVGRALWGDDGRTGLLVDHATMAQQMRALLWTVRTAGGAAIVVLVGIFWRLSQSVG